MNRNRCQYKFKVTPSVVGITMPWAACGCDVKQVGSHMDGLWTGELRRLGTNELCLKLASFWRGEQEEGLTFLFDKHVYDLPRGRYEMRVLNDGEACAWIELEIVKTVRLDMTKPTLLVEGVKVV